MTHEELIAYARSKPYATLDFPFDGTTLAIRIGGRIFALLDTVAESPGVNLKCDPEAAGDLRAAYPAVTPGWHMNKEHWNTVRLDGSLPGDLVQGLVDRSYELVLATLSARERERAGLPPKVRRNRRT